MTNKVAELKSILTQDDDSSWISNMWDLYNTQRQTKLDEWDELRNYIFAIDTTKTTNSKLPWRNTTTTPKLCQIRDNLHANYMSALFPNNDWLQWEGYSKEDSTISKSQAIEGYMRNKARNNKFRETASKLIYDYIDYGNAFAQGGFESRYVEDDRGLKKIQYIGPMMYRISPLDIVFNPLSSTFEESYKIVRCIKTIGELKLMSESSPDLVFWKDALDNRDKIKRSLSGFSRDDFNKADAYSIDGFGNLQEYYNSEFVEILTFYGDYHDLDGVLHTSRMITVVDRSYTVDNRAIPTADGIAPIRKVGWRERPDNLWSMGPLDNLVGMQYMIDHLENLKADAIGLAVMPPLKIIGEVEEFTWGPMEEVHIDENGDVGEIAKNLSGVITAANDINEKEHKMELLAGAPRDAMGIRTPGEKTAFEVAQLQNAAGRIFQEKVTNFEIGLLEPVMNDMLDASVRNLDGSDVIRVFDDDLNSNIFITITKEDIKANGKLKPVGARHFAEQSRTIQDLSNLFSNQALYQLIAPHISAKALTKTVERLLNIEQYSLFSPNAAIQEAMETQRMQNSAEEQMIMEDSVGGI